MEHLWNVTQMNRNPVSGVVTTVHWDLTTTDGVSTNRVYGSVGLDQPNEGDAIIDYNLLTKEIVLEWVWAKLDREEVEFTNECAVECITTPEEATGTPW